jgi:ribosome maturation factor RimP
MANQSQTEQQIRQIAERVASSEGLEIVEVTLRGGGRQRLLRVFIDKPAGVSHADCELISREVGTILDIEDVISGPYRLEVSSPGLDRKLLKAADYERFAGKKARVKLRQPVDGQLQFTGRLLAAEAGAIGMTTEAGVLVRFRFEDVEQARLVVEL